MFPLSKNITFDNKIGDATLLVSYDKEADILPGLPYEIAQYTIHAGKVRHADAIGGSKTKFTMCVSNDIH